MFNLSGQLPKRKNQWSQKFSKALELREKNKISDAQEKYVPRFVKSNSVTGFVDRERELEPTPYVEENHGSRNSLCSVCNLRVKEPSEDILVCDLCPAISHKVCANPSKCCLKIHLDHFTNKYKKHIREKMAGHGIWCCSLCSKEIQSSIEEESKRLKDDRFNRMAFFAAMKLQASCMRFKAQRSYRILYNGIIRMQARCRGVQVRKSFVTELASTHRAFRIKNCEFELPGIPVSDTKSNVSCIICIVNNENNGLDDSERQMYRFDTHGIAQHNVSGRWSDSFIVHSCNPVVKITFTLHAKEHEHSSARTIFLGQHVIDAKSFLIQSFFTGKPFRMKGELQSLDIEPRDQRFSFLKGEDFALKNNSYGRVAFEVHPISNVESKCGVIEEILNATLRGAKKKWHAVLAEKHLYLFSQYGDSRPKITIHLTHGSYVSWYDEKCEIIKLSNLNSQCWLFSCANPQQLKAWYNKLTGAYSKKLHNEAKNAFIKAK